VVGQAYNAYGSPEEIILGNEAVLKCSIPSFVADFVSVIGWTDSEDVSYYPGKSSDGNGGTVFPTSCGIFCIKEADFKALKSAFFLGSL
jgi:hypothetical protein